MAVRPGSSDRVFELLPQFRRDAVIDDIVCKVPKIGRTICILAWVKLTQPEELLVERVREGFNPLLDFFLNILLKQARQRVWPPFSSLSREGLNSGVARSRS